MGTEKRSEDAVVDEKLWTEFWEKIRKTDVELFRVVRRTLNVFVNQYPKESGYLTIDDLDAILGEISS